MSGFEELADGTIVWRDIKPSNFRVDAAIYYEDEERPGHWLPHSVFGEWDGEGYCASEYDCDHVGGHLYCHDAGGGPPYASARSKPDPCPARIWIRDGVDVVDGSTDRVVLSDEDLRERGYLRVHGSMPDPLADAIEGRVRWCDVCEADVCEEDTDDCCVCGEPVHLHLGSVAALVDPSEGSLDREAGAFVILELPFVTSCLIGGGWFKDRALARVGDLPPGVETDYAGAPLCRSCAPGTGPGPCPRPMTTYQLGLLRRLASPGPINTRGRARLLGLATQASIEDAPQELARLLAVVRQRASLDLDVMGWVYLRQLIRSALEESPC